MNKVGSGGWFFEGEVNDVITGPWSGFFEYSLGRTVMGFFIISKFGAFLDAVTGEGAGGLFNVIFGVVAFAEDKELKEFAGKVFIGLTGGTFI